MLSLITNWVGKAWLGIRSWPGQEPVCSWVFVVSTGTAESSLGFGGAVELHKHFPQPGEGQGHQLMLSVTAGAAEEPQACAAGQ